MFAVSAGAPGGGAGAAAGTTDEAWRWEGLSTALALFVGVSWPAVQVAAAFGAADPSSLSNGGWAAFTSGWVLTLVYAFGADTYAALREARGRGRAAPASPEELRRAFANERGETAEAVEAARDAGDEPFGGDRL